MNNYFADNIRYLRKRAKLTQKELGVKLGKSSNAIANWEQGVRQPIVRDTIAVCKLFGVDFDDLLYSDLSLHIDTDTTLLGEAIGVFKQLTEDQQKAVIATMKAMVR